MSKSIQLKDNKNEKMYPHPYYPVGSIYLSVTNTNPSKWFGGTWEQIAKGRTLVGVDTGDTDFNIVKKTGGEKNHKLTIEEMPNHEHKLTLSAGVDTGLGNRVVVNDWYWDTKSQSIWGTVQTVGGNQPHNNLQPYFTCYIWCRTA